MSRREFRFSDGSSNKFWTIECKGTSHTVNFGRIGTSGQTQTKDFSTEDEAKKAAEKLIAEKVKKGYTEVTNENASPAPAASAEPAVEKPKAKATKKATAEEPKAEETPVVEQPKPAPAKIAAVIPSVTHTIDLEPEDLENAKWPKKWKPLTRETPQPFDINRCVETLTAMDINKWGRWDYQWPTKIMPSSMSGQEAHFWLRVMQQVPEYDNSSTKTRNAAKNLFGETFKEKLTVDEAVALLQSADRADEYLMKPLAFLLEPKDLLSLIFHDWKNKYGHNRLTPALLTGFGKYVVPYLDEPQLKSIQDEVRSRLPNLSYACEITSILHMYEELAAHLALVDKPSAFSNRSWVLSLGDPKRIESEGRRLKLRLDRPSEVRHWLAATQFSGLDVVRDSVLNADTSYDHDGASYRSFTAKEQAERLTKEFIRVKSPEAAPHMLTLKLESKAPGIARQWLEDQMGNAIVGLLPIAAGRGKLAEAAVEFLREAKKKGHEAFIREVVKTVAPEVAESVTRSVLEHAEKEYAEIDPKSLPADLKSAFDAKPGKAKLPVWAALESLPPILIGDKKLNAEQTTAVLSALQRSTLEKVDPLVTAVKQHADAGSIDAFAWKLFQLWQAEGSPPKEKWAMISLGLFGGDAAVLKLTPLVRNWPGESQHQRAVFGLACLRTIGTDTALMALNGIAQKLKFKGLKQKASEAMEAIAKDKGLTRTQLEDRIVPDCDLDERGSRIFDFGPRQFKLVLGQDMKPMLKDADGKVKTDLPKPTSKDDEAKASQAVSDWKLMKKQVKEVVAIQVQRLEQAMVTGRRWPLADFETLLVKHPLMTNLVRLLLWGGYNDAGKLAATFRVTEDQTYADVKDSDFKLQGFAEVGIVHPFHLTGEQQSAWGEVFSDYEIVPPFRQLGRTIFRLEKGEEDQYEIKRFVGTKIPAPTMVYGLEAQGWIRGAGMDGGGFDEHIKPFPTCNVTAVVHYDGCVAMGYIDPNESLAFENAYFVEGIRKPSGYERKEKSLRLGDVDPVAVSEVLTNLTALAAKGKS